ncbi:BZ3500_MvSof-1268-A1-R1_Chr8-2g10175 [Microbotryum saponariae]|uniref:BZ3500_MvSof-1268-A1-R1_Chr8-2g10175 protein n=1 Tax=Microbotryum saponariae TaxID=289078 RepID=A0A2X0MQ12_9BASI|nr:BZ3500_MvSof-1268-A1-R1_Chr8-2g10175 [Microbotryum saponariae]SDA01939.1 BZ3501_MvSof-1269-A2-R1_Chr8-2g09926 [Microbotryum saponariae]
MSSSKVILYAYPQSPFAAKLELVLTLKQVPYHYVEVERMPPRPALHLLNITYRRIPVLAIDSDLYLDTSLAVQALEERFPDSPSLSQSHWGLQTATAFHWSDRAIFQLAAGALPWTELPEGFVKDRSAYRGGQIDPQTMVAARPKVLSALRSHIDLVEKQLASRSSEKTFLLGTDKPTYLDISLYFSLNWVSGMSCILLECWKLFGVLNAARITGFGTADSIFKPASGTSPDFPLTFAWMTLIKSAVEDATSTAPGKKHLSPEDAVTSITSSPASKTITVDEWDPLLVAKWFAIGDLVEITPNDVGKVPQKGKLVGLDKVKVSLEVQAEGGKGTCTVHAPRLGFDVKKIN